MQMTGASLENCSGKPFSLQTTFCIFSKAETLQVCISGLKDVFVTTSEPTFSFIRSFASDLFEFETEPPHSIEDSADMWLCSEM